MKHAQAYTPRNAHLEQQRIDNQNKKSNNLSSL